MPTPVLRTFLSILKDLGSPLGRRSFVNFVIIAVGWIQTYGTHAVTEALVVTGVAGKRHHEAFHRFFSRGTWNPDRLGYWLFCRLERWMGPGAVRICIDDTLAPKKGAEVFGIGTHIDAVRSSRRQKVFSFGHCWVVLAVVVRVPFSKRAWALPMLLRLYRNKKACPTPEYAKKTQMARQMIEVFASWTDRRIELTADCAYCNDTVTRGLPDRIVLFGAMRPDAVLTALPDESQPGPEGGRPKKRGKVLPKPECIARDGRRPWRTCKVFLYGRERVVSYKTICGQWYRACGPRLLRIVIVETDAGTIAWRVFFCTDASLSVPEILAGYGSRWSIECFFRDGKQLLGFADSCAHKKQAVLRVAPFVALLYSALVLWFMEGASLSPLATPPVRPWYLHKRGLSFHDILRAARRALAGIDVFDLLNDIENLAEAPRRSGISGRPPGAIAA